MEVVVGESIAVRNAQYQTIPRRYAHSTIVTVLLSAAAHEIH